MTDTKIIISNPELLQNTITKIKADGAGQLHLLADFDYTLTHAYKNGERIRSLMGVMRQSGYLGAQFIKDGEARVAKYHPIEINYNLSLAERTQYMREWWDVTHGDIMKYGLTQTMLDKICAEYPLNFRDGVKQFFSKLHTANVPIVIMSAAPADMIARYIKQLDSVYNNVHIVANWYIFDNDGKMIGVKEPIIHSLNKYETTLEHLPIFSEIQKRPNVILIGDSIDDIGMVTGFDYKNLIKIGFYNQPTDEHLSKYQDNFDVVITGDGDMNFVNELLNKVIS